MARLFGRMTVFGEYLMDHGQGYSVPCPFWLATTGRDDQIHDAYDPALDRSAALVRAHGIQPMPTLYGNLPLGYGFAGSTALTLLHLDGQVGPPRAYDIVASIDERLHGFPPSGVDLKGIVAQRAGIYGRGSWVDAPDHLDRYGLCLLPPATMLSLDVVRDRVQAQRPRLDRACRHLTTGLTRRGLLDLDALADYSLQLRDCDVYAPPQRVVIDLAIQCGAVAKGIGGLYNKAILLAGPAAAVTLAASQISNVPNACVYTVQDGCPTRVTAARPERS